MSEHIDPFELHGVQAVLFVADVQRTLDYYRDVLGFSIDFAGGDPIGHARVSAGDRTHASAARIRFQRATAEDSITPSCRLYVHVGRDLDALFALYTARGVDSVLAPTNQPWGLREFVIRDCNGYRLIFAGEV